jgi:hypothetical protein
VSVLLTAIIITASSLGYILLGTLIYTYGQHKLWDDDACIIVAAFWPIILALMPAYGVFLLTGLGLTVVSDHFKNYLERPKKPRAPKIPRAVAREMKKAS